MTQASIFTSETHKSNLFKEGFIKEPLECETELHLTSQLKKKIHEKSPQSTFVRVNSYA